MANAEIAFRSLQIWNFSGEFFRRPVFRGAMYRKVFCVMSLGGWYIWRGYTWRGLFSQFYGSLGKPCVGLNNQFGTTSLHFRCKHFVKLMRMFSFAGFSKKRSSWLQLVLKTVFFSDNWWLASFPPPIQYFRQCHLCHRIVCNHLSRSHLLLRA